MARRASATAEAAAKLGETEQAEKAKEAQVASMAEEAKVAAAAETAKAAEEARKARAAERKAAKEARKATANAKAAEEARKAKEAKARAATAAAEVKAAEEARKDKAAAKEREAAEVARKAKAAAAETKTAEEVEAAEKARKARAAAETKSAEETKVAKRARAKAAKRAKANDEGTNDEEDADPPDELETTTTWGSEPWGEWNNPTMMNWQAVSAGGWSRDDWYKQGRLSEEQWEEQRKSEARAKLLLALTQPEHCPTTAYDRLYEALRSCEAWELPEEEVAEARQELCIRKQAFEQDIEKELNEEMARRRAARQAEDERYEVQRKERHRAATTLSRWWRRQTQDQEAAELNRFIARADEVEMKEWVARQSRKHKAASKGSGDGVAPKSRASPGYLREIRPVERRSLVQRLGLFSEISKPKTGVAGSEGNR